jgi:asparagine synthase (glutamine-hydrolysing)
MGKIDSVKLERACSILSHRGPDDEGVYLNTTQSVFLGHRRLSIIDLSASGHQPMSYGNSRFWIVYNGEVYNYKEIRRELRAAGLEFKTNSDTEVILAAYDRWGEKMLARLRGMFAFALWDDQEKALLLARDRFGIKPMYYTEGSGTFAFSSEIHALVEAGVATRTVDKQALWDYLSVGSVIQPRTILADVRALLPGHFLTLKKGVPTVHQYWDVEEATRGGRERISSMTYREAVADLRCHLEDATKHHLVSDVPVGAFLSGGIDSTAVVGLMSRLVHQPIKTYSVGFESQAGMADELAWARIASEFFGTDHHEVIVCSNQVVDVVERYLRAIDQPSVDGLNTFVVAEAAARGVKVALSGLGGDELFAGYPHFSWMQSADRIAPEGLVRLEGLIQSASRVAPSRWRERILWLSLPMSSRYARIRMLSGESEKKSMLRPGWLDGFVPAHQTERFESLMRKGLDIVGQLSYVELTGYLRDTLLRDVDVMSMAHSLEVRPVLLDHVLAEYSFSLPSQFKLGNGIAKRVFKEAVSDLLPPGIVRRQKRGFELPLTEWLRRELRHEAENAFNSEWAVALFQEEHRDRLRKQVKGEMPASFQSWAHFVLLSYLTRNNVSPTSR